ncbi:hypothetical protein LshimejAT787_0702020 [Lyophyllum shimeji]|uniref:Uncharacterized protein n=1 Tax=Lyophyllum shimeji TaxID=47721 RepID=A0A9P3PQT6_LYOSH|nr:hypothetical protein LshimejAT787_0702020 [Lyophyllum shimeji]
MTNISSSGVSSFATLPASSSLLPQRRTLRTSEKLTQRPSTPTCLTRRKLATAHPPPLPEECESVITPVGCSSMLGEAQEVGDPPGEWSMHPTPDHLLTKTPPSFPHLSRQCVTVTLSQHELTNPRDTQRNALVSASKKIQPPPAPTTHHHFPLPYAAP